MLFLVMNCWRMVCFGSIVGSECASGSWWKACCEKGRKSPKTEFENSNFHRIRSTVGSSSWNSVQITER